MLHLILFIVFFLLFFVKQKTAYEMRISDWSSDVCSSDLPIITHLNATAGCIGIVRKSALTGRCPPPVQFSRTKTKICRSWRTSRVPLLMMAVRWLVSGRGADGCGSRSEEHTSELQSLMRISYAVFCLKKKNQTRIIT